VCVCGVCVLCGVCVYVCVFRCGVCVCVCVCVCLGVNTSAVGYYEEIFVLIKWLGTTSVKPQSLN